MTCTVEDCDGANKQMGGNFADRFVRHCPVPDDVTRPRHQRKVSVQQEEVEVSLCFGLEL